MDYKHACVVDAERNYKTLVLVLMEQDEEGQIKENIQYYTLQDGEGLVDAIVPFARSHADAPGLVRPRWDDETAAWAEGATAEEIAAWEVDHPAPANLAAPTAEEQLRADVDFLAAIQGVEL